MLSLFFVLTVLLFLFLAYVHTFTWTIPCVCVCVDARAYNKCTTWLPVREPYACPRSTSPCHTWANGPVLAPTPPLARPTPCSPDILQATTLQEGWPQGDTNSSRFLTLFLSPNLQYCHVNRTSIANDHPNYWYYRHWRFIYFCINYIEKSCWDFCLFTLAYVL